MGLVGLGGFVNIITKPNLTVTPSLLKFNLIASRVKLMNYLIYFKGDIILYYDHYKENK